jgi:hypothetical protein
MEVLGHTEIRLGLSAEPITAFKVTEPNLGFSFCGAETLAPSTELCFDSNSFCLSEKEKTAAKDFLLIDISFVAADVL